MTTMSLSDARESWNRYHKQRGVHASFEQFAAAVGAPVPVSAPKPAAPTMTMMKAAPPAPPPPEPTPEDRFAADPALVAEFGSFERFSAYCRATAAGRVKLRAPALNAQKGMQ